ncbi:MAG: hypothetical protein WCX46_02945 [Candidatus Paceibacterota bacterium]
MNLKKFFFPAKIKIDKKENAISIIIDIDESPLNPGEKTEGKYILVYANSKKEAIEKVKNKTFFTEFEDVIKFFENPDVPFLNMPILILSEE